MSKTKYSFYETSAGFKVIGGTASQFLKADGSRDSNSYALSSHSHTFASLTAKPTTLSGYGITDAISSSHVANGITAANITNWSTAFGWGNHVGLYAPISHSHSFSSISSKPTTLPGYGITDAVSKDANRHVDFGYQNITSANANNVESTQGTLKLDGWNNISIGAISTYGTRLTIIGEEVHDKTQLYFNGANGSIQYRKSWFPNTDWTPLRTIWDSSNLSPVTTNTNQEIQGVKTFTNPIYSLDFIGTSDARLKENIESHILKELNTDYKEFNFKGDDVKRVGLIAQDVEKHHPEFVRINEKGIKSISYVDLHCAEIAYLKMENRRLKKDLELIKEKLGL